MVTICALTPCVRDIEVGTHEFQWRADGLVDRVEQIEISKADSLHRVLVKDSAVISTTRLPRGIQLALDGQI